MKSSAKVRLAATLVFLAIALGAFGAHGLESRLEETGRLDNWETATLYHLIHGLAMFVVALRGGRSPGFFCFLVGILLFSGSLYALALSDIGKLGAITPLGGVSFLVGWARWIFASQQSLENE
ncbi:MAG: DUF423 domain-containing protein [Verrucomicrobiales bacterium]|nr:DUF423 domain-containing protein [Verrucomicrobiales bacterium]